MLCRVDRLNLWRKFNGQIPQLKTGYSDSA